MGMFEEIRNLARQIPKGKVTTYRTIAHALGIKDARVVGWALHGNKNPSIPCHRVVKKGGILAENYAFGGLKAQKEKLEKEGVKFSDKFQVDLKNHFQKPTL